MPRLHLIEEAGALFLIRINQIGSSEALSVHRFTAHDLAWGLLHPFLEDEEAVAGVELFRHVRVAMM